MILRKPNFKDIYKATQLLSDDEEEQKQILQEWLYQHKNNSSFFSYVIVKDHEVLAVVTGWFNDEIATVAIGRMEGNERLKQTIFNKILKEFDPERITVALKELDRFASNFKVESYNLVWSKQEKEDEVIETDENSTSVEEGNNQ